MDVAVGTSASAGQGAAPENAEMQVERDEQSEVVEVDKQKR